MSFSKRDNKQRVDDVIVDYCRRENVAIDAGYFAIADILQLILDDMRGYNFLVRMKCPPDMMWNDTKGLAERINGKHKELYMGVFNKDTMERLLEEYKHSKEKEGEEDDSID
tara:strand:- start:3587 stop:3922 length:336 start_codon:yes stop_codon:yes gene_type:complete